MSDSYILGVSAFYHDSAACILKNGQIVAAAQEERFTRKKHDQDFPKNAVDFCLNKCGITASELSLVAFYDKPWLKFERLLETYLAFAPYGLSSFLKSMPLWLKEKLWMEESIKKILDYKGEVVFPEHHQSHAASAFFPSPYESAAILSIDGVGEWATTTWGVGKAHQMELKEEIRFPHSLGLLYSAFTYYAGFKVNSGEYKLMGLAPYGRALFKDKIYAELIDVKADGSFHLNMEYFNYCQGLTMTSPKFHKLFGSEPRRPESKLEQFHMDLAKSIQEVTEEIVSKIAISVRERSGEKNLCLAGGVALNCVSNGKLLSQKIFDSIWIQPAAGDAGGALGAALFAWHQVLGNPRKVLGGEDDLQSGSYLGPAHTNEEIGSWLEAETITAHRYSDQDLYTEVATHLSKDKVIGWFQGAMEFGPRALGARSILGDARSEEMQKKMNLKIKFRESFRPFAPSCLREDVNQYFEMDSASPYMLLVSPVREDKRKKLTPEEEALFGIEKLNVPRSDIPAVTHVDYSARVQTVRKDVSPRYYGLIEAFKKITGYGILINTSFNVRGEPIVCTPQDAFRCFMRTNMDVLVLENYVLLKEEQKALESDTDWQTEFELD